MNDITSRLNADYERKLSEQLVTGAIEELNDTIAALKAENERLRAALTAIQEATLVASGTRSLKAYILPIIRAALESDTP